MKTLSFSHVHPFVHVTHLCNTNSDKWNKMYAISGRVRTAATIAKCANRVVY